MTESPTKPAPPDPAALQLSAVALIAYVAGRTKKGSLALRLARMFAGRRSGLDLQPLLSEALTAVATTPDAEQVGQLPGSVLEGGRTAEASTIERQLAALSAALKKPTTAPAGDVKDATGEVGDTAGDLVETTSDAAAQAGAAAGEAATEAHHRAAALSGAAGKVTGLVGRRGKKGRAEGEQQVSEAGTAQAATEEHKEAAAQAGAAATEARHRAAALSGAAGKVTGLVGRRGRKGRAEGEQQVSEDAGSQDEEAEPRQADGGQAEARPRERSRPTKAAPGKPAPAAAAAAARTRGRPRKADTTGEAAAQAGAAAGEAKTEAPHRAAALSGHPVARQAQEERQGRGRAGGVQGRRVAGRGHQRHPRPGGDLPERG